MTLIFAMTLGCNIVLDLIIWLGWGYFQDFHLVFPTLMALKLIGQDKSFAITNMLFLTKHFGTMAVSSR